MALHHQSWSYREFASTRCYDVYRLRAVRRIGRCGRRAWHIDDVHFPARLKDVSTLKSLLGAPVRCSVDFGWTTFPRPAGPQAHAMQEYPGNCSARGRQDGGLPDDWYPLTVQSVLKPGPAHQTRCCFPPVFRGAISEYRNLPRGIVLGCEKPTNFRGFRCAGTGGRPSMATSNLPRLPRFDMVDFRQRAVDQRCKTEVFAQVFARSHSNERDVWRVK